VWRSENGRRRSLERLADGLPKSRATCTVLPARRSGYGYDRLRHPALYFLHDDRSVWLGREGGEPWDACYDSLPPIHNFKVAASLRRPAVREAEKARAKKRRRTSERQRLPAQSTSYRVGMVIRNPAQDLGIPGQQHFHQTRALKLPTARE